MKSFILVVKTAVCVTHANIIINQQVTRIWKKLEDQYWTLQTKENVKQTFEVWKTPAVMNKTQKHWIIVKLMKNIYFLAKEIEGLFALKISWKKELFHQILWAQGAQKVILAGLPTTKVLKIPVKQQKIWMWNTIYRLKKSV